MSIFKWAILLLSFASLPVYAGPRSNGWENGNAGDIFTAEFRLTGLDIVQRLRYLDRLPVDGLNLDLLNNVILAASLTSEEFVVRNDKEVDAWNVPEAMSIIVSRSRWREYRAPSETRRRLLLVLHEFLYLMKDQNLNDDGFIISQKLISALNVTNYNPDHWWTPLNPVNQISLQLVYSTTNCALPLAYFDPLKNDEKVVMATSGDCGSQYRRVVIEKTAATAPPASGYRGIFHSFNVQVFDGNDNPVGQLSYEPPWGLCLLPQEGSCRLSGRIGVGGVNFSFMLFREAKPWQQSLDSSSANHLGNHQEKQ